MTDTATIDILLVIAVAGFNTILWHKVGVVESKIDTYIQMCKKQNGFKD